MSETWIPGFKRDPMPAWKQGYFNIPSRPLDLIEGDVKHDAAGPWAALIGEIQNPTRQASWTISIPTERLPDGSLGHQHAPLEAITWHCGKPGDADLETAYIGNITLLGIEHAREGTSPAEITPFQVETTVYITRFLREHSQAARRFAPELAVNLWEHNWISHVTSCPSGRIPWDDILAGLGQEDDMAIYIHAKGDTRVFLFDGHSKRYINGPMSSIAERAGIKKTVLEVTQAEFDAIPEDAHPAILSRVNAMAAAGGASAAGVAALFARLLGAV